MLPVSSSKSAPTPVESKVITLVARAGYKPGASQWVLLEGRADTMTTPLHLRRDWRY